MNFDYDEADDQEEVSVTWVSIVRQTDAAILFGLPNPDRSAFDEIDVWLPKSQILDLDYEEQTVTVPEWLAYEKGLI